MKWRTKEPIAEMDAKEERLGVFLNPRVSVDIESLKPLGPFYLPLASAFSDRCVK